MKTKKRCNRAWAILLAALLAVCPLQMPVSAAESATDQTVAEEQVAEDVSTQESVTEDAAAAELGTDERAADDSEVSAAGADAVEKGIVNAETEPAPEEVQERQAGSESADAYTEMDTAIETDIDINADASTDKDEDTNTDIESHTAMDADTEATVDVEEGTEETVSTSPVQDTAVNVNRIIHIQDGKDGGTVVLGVNGRNTYQLQLRIFYDQSTSYDENEAYVLSCESEDGSVIATVDQDGLVTALAPGKFEVYADTAHGTWCVRMFEIRETVYQVTLDLNGGTVKDDDNYRYSFYTTHIVDGGETINVSDRDLGYNALERPGYLFEGWTLEKNGDAVLEGEYAPSSNVTLYAKWKKLYEVRVDLNGGDWIRDENNGNYWEDVFGSSQFYNDGESFYFPDDSVFSRAGHVFQGWTTVKDGNDLIPDKVFSYAITGDITFYAKWAKAYTVKFDPNGGTITGGIFTNWKQSPQRIKDAHGYYADGLCVVIGKSIELPNKYSIYYNTPVISRDSYELSGWTVTRNGSDVLSGTYKPTGDITLYAKWKKPGEDIAVTGLSLDKKTADLAVGAIMKITADVIPLNATDKTITWSSSDSSVASVDKNGLVKALKYGTATITARSANGKTATCKIQTRFKDVNNSGKSYYTPVYWAVDKGITVCTVSFRPEDSVTRGEFVTFLWRLAGKPKSTARVNFKDVNTSTQFYGAIRWAVGRGIIKGYKDGKFKSNNPVTRGETATMLWRYAGKPTPKTKTSPFSDINASSKADSTKAILWGSENGIIKGTKGQFLKDDTCTRGQIVTFLYRYKQKY